ncbi:MAG: hypothetical protein V8Q79_07810 [Christensenellales bacterium]
MQFQMRQSVSYAVICGKACFLPLSRENGFFDIWKIAKIARVSKSFVFFANYGGSEGGLSPLLYIAKKCPRVQDF